MRFIKPTLILTAALASQISTSQSYSGHGADSIDSKILEKFAPKAISAAELDPIERILDLRSPSSGLLASDASALYFNWSVTGTNQVWKKDGKDGFPVQLTGGQDATNLQDITRDNKYLVITRDSKGDEYSGIYLQSVDGGALKTVFQKKKVATRYAGFSKDGQSIYFSANDKSPTSYVVYKYHIKSAKLFTLFDEPGTWSLADENSKGELLLANWKGSDWVEYIVYDPKSKKKTPLLGHGEREVFRAVFGLEDDEFFVQTDKLQDFEAIYHYKSGKFTQISPKLNHEISWFNLDDSKTRILYTINKNGYYETGAMDAKTYEPLKLPELPSSAIHNYFGSTTHDGRYTSFQVSFYDKPSISYIYDWNKNKLEQWVLSSSPEVDTSGYAKPTLEYYEANDGTKIPMFVYRSKECETKVCPTVVSFHGGPESQSTPRFSPFIQLFVKRGFVYVQPNIRGSSGYGKKWLHSDNRAKRLDVISDIRDAGLWIKKNWAKNGVTPKVGVTGGSYGGYATFVAMTMYAGTYESGSAIVGMSNLVSFLENTAPYRRKLRESEYGYLDQDMDALKKLSPINYIENVKAPLQILHGATDPRVPAGESIQIQEILAKNGQDVDLVLFPDEGHGFKKRKNRAIANAYILRFFEKTLK